MPWNNEYTKLWRAKHKEHLLEYERQYRAKRGPEYRQIESKKYREKYADEIKARKKIDIESGAAARRQAAWRRANPEKAKALRDKEKIKYRAYNAHYSLMKKARRRLATIGDLTDIRKIYDRCQELRKWFSVVVDHIIPISRGGAHEAANLQIIYDFENQRKYNKPDYKPRVIFR